jgi:hypothetical protein
MAPLDDAFLKLKRGKEHLRVFYKKVKVVFDTNQVRIEIKNKPHPKPADDPRPWNTFTVYISAVPAISKEDCVLLGEGIQCLRSSLDYAVWSLVLKNSRGVLSETQKRNVMFPMVRSRKNYWENVNRYLPNLSSVQKSFFERYQPYRHSEGGTAIRNLNKLSNFDKHRIVLPTVMWPETGGVQLDYREWFQHIRTTNRYKVGTKIQVGTKIMTSVLAGAFVPNQGQVRVNSNFTIYPVFPRSVVNPLPSPRLMPAQQITEAIVKVCTEILTEASNYF